VQPDRVEDALVVGRGGYRVGNLTRPDLDRGTLRTRLVDQLLRLGEVVRVQVELIVRRIGWRQHVLSRLHEDPPDEGLHRLAVVDHVQRMWPRTIVYQRFTVFHTV